MRAQCSEGLCASRRRTAVLTRGDPDMRHVLPWLRTLDTGQTPRRGRSSGRNSREIFRPYGHADGGRPRPMAARARSARALAKRGSAAPAPGGGRRAAAARGRRHRGLDPGAGRRGRRARPGRRAAPVEARLTEALLGRIGAVVSRDALSRAGWPAGAPGRNALDVHVLRLRRRLSGLGLAIRTVRSRGYLLERADGNVALVGS